MIRKREDAITFEMIARVVLYCGRSVEWDSVFRVEQKLRNQRLLALVLTSQSNRRSHITTSTISTSKHSTHTPLGAKWVAPLRRKTVFDTINLNTRLLSKQSQSVFEFFNTADCVSAAVEVDQCAGL